MEIRIIIDNDDREECEDAPWTASLYATTDDGRDVELDSAGTGESVQDAIHDLIVQNADDPHDEVADIVRGWARSLNV